MVQITLRSGLGRRMSSSEYNENLLSFENNIENLKLLIDSCCGAQSWESYDPVVLTTDSPNKLSLDDMDSNFEILLDRIEELEEKLISCCSTGNSVSGSLVLRKNLNRKLTIGEVDGNFILLKSLLDELFEIQDDCCSSGPPVGNFLLTEDDLPILTEDNQNLILE